GHSPRPPLLVPAYVGGKLSYRVPPSARRRAADTCPDRALVAAGCSITVITGRAIGLEPIGRTARVYPVAALRYITRPDCGPTHRAVGLVGVRGAVGAGPTAALGHVTGPG